MPRLTSAQYLQQRKQLRADWFEDDAYAFGHLTGLEQADLHQYFAPTETMNDDEALRHRSKMNESFPSLPQKAGRAYQSARLFLGGRPAPQPAPNRAERRHVPKKSRRVVVGMIRRPKVDAHKLVRVLVELAAADLKEWDEKHKTG
ncbi:MAG TPA: hypothetical protein VNT53_06495 [Pseudolysinimonas sp.]|nr:hypothetical protein [Pseudolysinimonas sp.]